MIRESIEGLSSPSEVEDERAFEFQQCGSRISWKLKLEKTDNPTFGITIALK